MLTPVAPALDAVIGDPEAVMGWYRAISQAEQALRDQIKAESIAVHRRRCPHRATSAYPT